ncbi:MAG: lamin tail domain-containing protein [Pseudomonadota bacterium]
MKILLLIVLAGCARPADEDCWRGPVPIVRDCAGSFDVGSGAPPADASASAPPQGVLYRVAPMDVAVEEPTALSEVSLQITQLMIDPTDLPDRDGEWVEIHNPTPLPAPLADIEIAVNGSRRCVLADATIPAFGYVLIARAATPDRLPCSRLSLPNKRGEVALVRFGEVIDVVVWEKAPQGESLSASPRLRRSSPRPRG